MKIKSHETKQPRKKRKARYDAKMHVKRKYAFVHLSKELRLKLKKRSAQPKKGDKVKIMRGNYKGRSGKIIEVDLVHTKLFVEGVIRKKQGGQEKFVAIHPSNCTITEYQEPKLKQKKTGAAKAPQVQKQQPPAAKPAAQAQKPAATQASAPTSKPAMATTAAAAVK